MPNNEEMFHSAFGGSGSIATTCHCGRTHFEPDAGGYDIGELEYLLKESDAKPDEFIASSSVSHINVDWKTFVFDCPCKGYEHYAKFIWAYRHPIMEYLKARIEQDYELAHFTRQKMLAVEKTMRKCEKTVLPE